MLAKFIIMHARSDLALSFLHELHPLEKKAKLLRFSVVLTEHSPFLKGKAI